MSVLQPIAEISDLLLDDWNVEQNARVTVGAAKFFGPQFESSLHKNKLHLSLSRKKLDCFIMGMILSILAIQVWAGNTKSSCLRSQETGTNWFYFISNQIRLGSSQNSVPNGLFFDMINTIEIMIIFLSLNHS